MTWHKLGWTPRFQADVADIPQDAAIQLLTDISAFAKTGIGDVKKLVNDPAERWRRKIDIRICAPR